MRAWARRVASMQLFVMQTEPMTGAESYLWELHSPNVVFVIVRPAQHDITLGDVTSIAPTRLEGAPSLALLPAEKLVPVI